MNKPEHHIFVCTSSRINGMQKGYCHSKNSEELITRFMEEIEEQDLDGKVFVSNTGCFGICAKGPVVLVYPDNVWYGSVSPDDVEEIISEHIIGGKVVARLEI